MFTGIVEDTGTVHAVRPKGPVIELVVETAIDLGDTRLGDSIAIDGVCLTVTALDDGRVSFDIGPESLRVTALDGVARGQRVHLERALALGDRLGGHLVQGHVDGVGEILARTPVGADTLKLRVRAPDSILALSIHKGSITINGVSLTINQLDADAFEVWLIPHTLERTRLGELKVSDRVNLEADLIGKYIARLVGPHRPTAGVTMDLLAKSGFLSSD